MLEQSRQIGTMTQAPTRMPAFQEGPDAISMGLDTLSRGLQVFGQIQRQNTMLKQQEEQSAFNDMIDAEAVVMANLSATLRDQPGITSSYIERTLRGTFPRLDDATYAKVLKRHAEITGESLSGLYKAADAADKEADAAAKAEYDFNLQMAEVELYAKEPPPYNDTMENKQRWFLDATRRKNFMKQRTDDVEYNKEQYQLGLIDRPTLLNSVSSAMDVTTSMGLSKLVNRAFEIDPADKESKQLLLTELQRSISTAAPQLQKLVRDTFGININLAEAEDMSRQVVDGANIALTFLSGTGQSTIIDNANKVVLDRFLDFAGRSQDAVVASSAIHLQASIALGQPLSEVAVAQIQSDLMRFIRNADYNKMSTKAQEEEVKKLPKTLDAVLSPDLSKATPFSPKTQDEHKEFVFDIVVNNLNPPAHKKTPVSDKAAMTVVSALARNENAIKNLPEGSAEVVLESLEPYKGRIAASITSMLSKPALKGNLATAPSTGGTDTDFDFNVETLEIRSKGMVRSGEAQNLNKFIKDYLKAVENMGGDTKAAKEDIRAAIAAKTGGMTR